MSDQTTPTLNNWIASAKKNNGTLPTPGQLAGWAKVGIDDAVKALDMYKDPGKEYTTDKHVQETPKSVHVKSRVTVRRVVDFMLDGGSLIVALVVDIVMNVVGFSILAFDDWSRVGFVASAFVVVLFALRAWIKGKWHGKALWAMFALIAAFLDISLSVASSHQQSMVVVYDASKDDVLIKLKEKADEDQKYLQALRDKQIEKGEGYKSQIDLAVAQSNASTDSVKSYHHVESFERGYLHSADIFTAIPDAALSGNEGRIIGMVFFGIFFIALQLTIVASATNGMKKIKDE
jgi:predicted secreted protein